MREPAAPGTGPGATKEVMGMRLGTMLAFAAERGTCVRRIEKAEPSDRTPTERTAHRQSR